MKLLLLSVFLSPLAMASDCYKGLEQNFALRKVRAYANERIDQSYPRTYKGSFVFEKSYFDISGNQIKPEIYTSLSRKTYKESPGTLITPPESEHSLHFGTGNALSWSGSGTEELKDLISSLKFNLDFIFNLDNGVYTRNDGSTKDIIETLVDGSISIVNNNNDKVTQFPLIKKLEAKKTLLGWGGGFISDSKAHGEDFSITLKLTDVMPKDLIENLLNTFKLNIPKEHSNKEFLLDKDLEKYDDRFAYLNKQVVDYDFEDLLSVIDIDKAKISISREKVNENIASAISMFFDKGKDPYYVHAWVDILIPTKDPNIVGRINFPIVNKE